MLRKILSQSTYFLNQLNYLITQLLNQLNYLNLTQMELTSVIDHTILRPDCSPEDIETLCEEAHKHSFAAVCVPPYFVKNAVRKLEESPVRVATVIGFPMGYACTPAKVEEVKRAIEEGADEVDVVINICAVKNKHWAYVKNDIDSIAMAAHSRGKIVKVILETGLLNEEELQQLCEICNQIGVDFVKTSTGVNGGGATLKAVRFLRKNLNDNIKIKASGGIRNQKSAQKFVDAGASRIGTSSGIEIVKWIMMNAECVLMCASVVVLK